MKIINVNSSNLNFGNVSKGTFPKIDVKLTSVGTEACLVINARVLSEDFTVNDIKNIPISKNLVPSFKPGVVYYCDSATGKITEDASGTRVGVGLASGGLLVEFEGDKLKDLSSNFILDTNNDYIFSL